MIRISHLISSIEDTKHASRKLRLWCMGTLVVLYALAIFASYYTWYIL